MARKRRRTFMGWMLRLVAYVLFLGALLAGGVTAAYFAGMRLPVYSDIASFALQNWNKTRQVDVTANYDSSLVRRDGRIHVTVDLALPETVDRLRAYLDGGRTLLVDCGSLKLYMHQLQNASMTVANPDIALAGKVDLELEGLLNLREGRNVQASVRLGHDRTTIWADLTRLEVEDLPDPMVEPILRDMARVTYTRAQILDLAAGGLSPELAELLTQHREALDLAFEDIIPGQAAETLTLQAVFSVEESAAFDMLGAQFTEAAGAHMTRVAGLVGVSSAHAQGLGPLGDLLDQWGAGDARKIIEEGLAEGGLEGLAAQLGASNCTTAF